MPRKDLSALAAACHSLWLMSCCHARSTVKTELAILYHGQMDPDATLRHGPRPVIPTSEAKEADWGLFEFDSLFSHPFWTYIGHIGCVYLGDVTAAKNGDNRVVLVCGSNKHSALTS